MTIQIPEKMFAWRKHKGNSEPVWEEIPVPQTPADGLLVKILAAGVCHSDYMLVKTDSSSPRYHERYTLGHEGCGEIVSVGPEMSDPRFKIGDVVAIHPGGGGEDEDCPGCARDLPMQKPGRTHHGIGMDGSFASYVAVAPQAAVPVPEGVSPAEAAVATDAVMTTHHAIVKRGGIRAKDTVFLFGLGGLGFNALQILLHIGARVIVSDTRQAPLDEAAKLGVPKDDIVPIGTPIPDFIAQRDLHDRIDFALELVCIQQTFSDAQTIVRRGGTILSVGLLGPEVSISPIKCVTKHLNILFCFGGHYSDIEAGLDLIANGKLSPSVETASLEEFPKILQDLHEGRIKSRMALIP